MNLSDITARAWILALFIRDDGQRFLLGDGWYDFKDSLQHFQPDNIANDVVELQGTDGQLLAGQVRRSGTQEFEGYIGDASISRATIETHRRDFLGFFAPRYKYKVVYIFPDGSAIQRQRGYLVEPPAVSEMWQFFPEYRVALSFEDVPYYEYTENSSGQEVYAHSLALTALAYKTVSGLNSSLTEVSSVYPKFVLSQPLGYASQEQTPSPTSPSSIATVTGLQTVVLSDGQGADKIFYINLGKNLLENKNTSRSANGLTFTKNSNGSVTISGKATARTQYYITANNIGYTPPSLRLKAGTYTLSKYESDGMFLEINYSEGSGPSKYSRGTFTTSGAICGIYIVIENGTTVSNVTLYPQLEAGSVQSPYQQYYTPIELCRLPNASDTEYIYKSGENWLTHKICDNVVLDGSEESWHLTTYSGKVCFWINNSDIPNAGTSGAIAKMCDRFEYTTDPYTSAPAPSLAENTAGGTPMFVFVTDGSYGSTVEAWKTWLTSHPVTVYYMRGSATNVTITSTYLANQLTALYNTELYSPQTNVTTTAEGSNLPSGFYIRYLSNANELTTVSHGISNSAPLWTVTGPATNPTLKNATTGKTLTYTGTVASGQSLVVDMANRTAKIGNTNVVASISGDWVEIAPGTNTLAFTTSNQTGTSNLYWNGIVG